MSNLEHNLLWCIILLFELKMYKIMHHSHSNWIMNKSLLFQLKNKKLENLAKMVSLKNGIHNSNLENYMVTYLVDKSRDCILYSEDGSKFSVHKEVFSQTSFLRGILYSAKGGLISEIFSRWLQSPNKCAKSQHTELSFKVDSA